MDILEEILEKSVEKNGANHVVTLGHLLAIVRMARKERDKIENIPYYDDTNS